MTAIRWPDWGPPAVSMLGESGNGIPRAPAGACGEPKRAFVELRNRGMRHVCTGGVVFLAMRMFHPDCLGRIRFEENPNATRNAGQEPGISSWTIRWNGIPLSPPWRGTLGTRGRVGGGRREA